MIRVIIADDHAVVRNGLCRILDSENDIEIIGEAGNGREAVSLCESLVPDVIVMDYDMPELDGLEATKRIAALNKNIRILVLTMYDREDFALKFLQAGATGFLPKNITFEELPFAVRRVASGSVYVTASSSKDNPKTAPAATTPAANSAQSIEHLKSLLSERELQVLLRIARGQKTGEIADAMNIGYNTVKTYRYRIMEKLDLKNVYDLVCYAVANGLIDKV